MRYTEKTRVVLVIRSVRITANSPSLHDSKKERTTSMEGTERADIKRGSRVSIVMKEDQRSGKLTEGIVKDILTNSPSHPHGIKVRLESGQVGRVKKIAVTR